MHIQKSSRCMKIASEEKRIVEGVVYEPDFIDSQDEFANAAEIEKAAHKFLTDYRNIGVMHKQRAPDTALVESYIAKADFMMGGQLVRAGSWCITTKVNSPELWKKIKAGEITGFSMGGRGRRVE